MFKTMADVRAANKAIGHHYFERSTMRFFDSRVDSSSTLAIQRKGVRQ